MAKKKKYYVIEKDKDTGYEIKVSIQANNKKEAKRKAAASKIASFKQFKTKDFQLDTE